MSSTRQHSRAVRSAHHHQARYEAAAGNPAAVLNAAVDDLRAAIRGLPQGEAEAEQTSLAAELRRRASEIRKRK